MSIELNWEKGLPSFVGMYFVAVKLESLLASTILLSGMAQRGSYK